MSIFFPLFFVTITNISWVLSSVVMMMPQNTNHKSFPESSVDEKPLPHPYNISWPIIGVSRYKFYERNSTCGWSSAWKYQCKHATVFAHQGGRETMEDRFVMDENINNTGISLYAVFDGYNGTFSVDYLAYNLMDTLKNKILDIKKNLGDENSKKYLHANGSINYRKLLHDEILAADKRLLKKLNEAKHIDPGCGCTALLAVIDHDQLYIANVGESRAVICNKEGIATRLTIDHNFESPQEIQRLVKEGADVYYAQGWSSTSRVLGDITHKGKDHVIPDPDVFIYDLSNSNSKFVVLASDGIWDCVAPSCRIKSVEEKVISCLNQNLDKNLFEAMINSTLYTYGQRFSDDNRTFMVVRTGRS